MPVIVTRTAARSSKPRRRCSRHWERPTLPQVDIKGFPFLTQLAAGSIGTMHVVADQLGVANNAQLTLAHADLVMSDVATKDWFKTMTISHAEGTSLLDYAKLSALAGAPLTYGSEGRVELVAKTNVFGREVEAVITGTPRLNAKEQTITLSDARISVAGVNLPDFTAQALLAALLRPIPLKGIPLGLTVEPNCCRRRRRACGPGGRQPDRCRLAIFNLTARLKVWYAA